MRKTTACAVLSVLGVSATANADVSDEKPWDWANIESVILRNRAGNGKCDAIAADNKAPDLRCRIDHKAWDDHLANEIKIEQIRRRNTEGCTSRANRSTTTPG